MLIARSALRAMRHLSATKDVRYYLNGVCVEIRNGKGTLTATDGSVMGAHRFDAVDEPDDTFIIPVDAIKAIKRAGGPSVEITHQAGQITIRADGAASIVKAIEGKFPDWRRVVPASVNGEVNHFCPDLLVRFAEAGRELFGTNTKQKPLLWMNGTSGALVNFEGYAEFIGVVMPRIYGTHKQPTVPPRPAWI